MSACLDEFHRLRAIETDDCVIWPYAKQPEGYGVIRYNGGTARTHRLALLLASGGVAPAGRVAAHGPCHNRACMNVRHLYWATQAENEADKLRDGTHQFGERNHMAKLTRRDVAAIREASGTQKAVAARFGVSQATVSRARNLSNWKEVA